jgi:hypothetical protein
MTTMPAGVAMSFDGQGNIMSARLMGGPDQCLDVNLATGSWCVLPYPHEGAHVYRDEEQRNPWGGANLEKCGNPECRCSNLPDGDSQSQQ